MSVKTEKEDWDDEFNQERARVVTLRDDKGKLYRIPSELLANESPALRAMVDDPHRAEGPFEANLSSEWIKPFLRYVQKPSPDSTRMAHFEATLGSCSTSTLAELFIWGDKAACSTLIKEIDKFGFQRCEDNARTKIIGTLFTFASQANCQQLVMTAMRLARHPAWTDMKVVDDLTDILRDEWKLPFVQTVLRCSHGKLGTSGTGAFFASRIGANKQQGGKRKRHEEHEGAKARKRE